MGTDLGQALCCSKQMVETVRLRLLVLHFEPLSLTFQEEQPTGASLTLPAS